MNNDGIIIYITEEIQSIFKCGKRQAYELVQTKGFPSIKIGKKILTEKKALKRWLEINRGKIIIKT